MAAEALIVEDAYQKGYADAMADMRKKKEQRRQREQAKEARRWYFIKQKACGLAMLAITVLAVWATEGDITIAFITVPLGLTCIFSKEMLIMKRCCLRCRYYDICRWDVLGNAGLQSEETITLLAIENSKPHKDGLLFRICQYVEFKQRARRENEKL